MAAAARAGAKETDAKAKARAAKARARAASSALRLAPPVREAPMACRSRTRPPRALCRFAPRARRPKPLGAFLKASPHHRRP
eukprot:7384399-Prymnesium_polylepis.1